MKLTDEEREILGQDYGAPSLDDRSRIDKYTPHLRGEVRIQRGLYRTPAEHQAWIHKGLALRLPGQAR